MSPMLAPFFLPFLVFLKNFRASFEAGFEAGLEGLKPWKLKQNNMTRGPFFGPQNVRKSSRAKMGLPSVYCSKTD